MAIVWRSDLAGKRYEVRSAGRSLRLYTNGAFHSQYNPGHLFSGAVWDLLTLPILFNAGSPRSVLLLGLGGGTAIHQINRLVAPDRVTAIELDPVHIDVARHIFGVNAPNVSLIHADAVRWLAHNRGKHDVIIDDLFVDTPDEPQRAQPVDAKWLRRLAARTRPHGVVIQNHLSPSVARKLVRTYRSSLERHFKTVLMFTTPAYENGILALYRDPVDKASGEKLALARISAAHTSAARRLKFKCTRLLPGQASM